MKSWTNPRDGIVIYFHLVRLQEPGELLLAAGRGDLHNLPTVAMPHWFFEYLFDTLNFIPTRRAALARVPMERPIIGFEGAHTARTIFAGWKQIFSVAEKEVSFTIGTGCPASKICAQRDDLVACLSSLEALTHEIEDNDMVLYLSDTPDFGNSRLVKRTEKRQLMQGGKSLRQEPNS